MKEKFEIVTTVPGFVTSAEIVSKLRAKYSGVTYDVSTTPGMAHAVAARKELRDARVALDKLKPEIKKEALDFCNKVEADYKAIRAAVSEFEDIPDAAIKADEARREQEKAEKASVAAEAQKVLDAKIFAIGKLPLSQIGKTVAEMTEFLTVLEARPFGDEFTGETLERAVAAKSEAVGTIREMLSATARAEEKAAEVKAEADRLETERQEREKQEAIQREALAKQQEALDEQKRLQDIEDTRLREEREKVEAEERGKQEAELKKQEEADAKKRQEDRLAEIEAERKRILAEKDRKAAEKARNLAEAKFKDAATALQAIQDICADNRLTDSEAREKIGIICEGNLL